MGKKSAPTAAQKAEREAQTARNQAQGTVLVLVNGRKVKKMSGARWDAFVAERSAA